MTDQSSNSNCDCHILTEAERENAIQSFIRIIQFETISATASASGEYLACAQYIKQQLSSISCFDEVFFLDESSKSSPVVVAKWTGIDETLPVLLFNSHYDVVPAEEDKWTVEPFSGIRKDGRIYGRGTQDMKCVCIQYIEAIRKLQSIKPDFRPARSIYLTFVPDEEIDGTGMAAFLASKLYQSLPGIALALDEGLASMDDTLSVFYGERLPWWVDVTATGPPGHGSRFIENTAMEQIIQIANRAMDFREGQRAVLHGSKFNAKHANCNHAVAAKRRRLRKKERGQCLTLGDVSSLNITTIQAGLKSGDRYAYNVVPSTASLSLDIRISPHMEPNDMKDLLDGWCQESSASTEKGYTCQWSFIDSEGQVAQSHSMTSTDVKVNPWYGVFANSLNRMGYKFETSVFPAATDSRFLRALNIRALGFSPMRNSEILLHENDEYLDESVFLEGIGVYVGLIESLASQRGEIDKA